MRSRNEKGAPFQVRPFICSISTYVAVSRLNILFSSLVPESRFRTSQAPVAGHDAGTSWPSAPAPATPRPAQPKSRPCRSPGRPFMGFGEEVAQGGAKRPGEHERDPEQHHAGNTRPVAGDHHQCNGTANQQRTAGKAQPRVIGQVVAQRCAKGVGKQDCHQ